MNCVHKHQGPGGRCRTIALVLGLMMTSLLAGGCGSKQNTLADPVQRMSPGDTHYVPADDGSPLSAAEVAALNSTGQVDKKISAKGMQDVTEQYKFYLRKGRATVDRSSKRAERYLAHSRKAFRDRGMPEELAYLAIVESGYNPAAISPAGAAGAWQFMPFTGNKYGLSQDWWMDERRDPYKSAEAAADYLKKLYGDFHDWHLAIAAYNAGEGKIGRALDKSGEVTFFNLSEKNHTLDDKAQLRQETKQYVPRFLAICKIMRNLESLGFAPLDVNRAQTMTRLQVRPGTDLLALSKAAGMEWAEFSAYNAAYKRYVSPTDRTTTAYVPELNRERAVAYLKNPNSTTYAGWLCYPTIKGDTWSKISQRCAVPVHVLQAANKKVGSLKAGTVVMVPGSDSLRTPPVRNPARDRATVIVSTPAAPAPRESARENTREKGREKGQENGRALAQKSPAAGSHTLGAGDTLSRVASLYDVSVEDLCTLNAIDDPRRIRQGQVIRIPAGQKNGANMVAQADKKAPVATIRPVTMSVTVVSSRDKDRAPKAAESTKVAAKVKKSADKKGDSSLTTAEKVHGSSGSLGRAASPAKKKQTYTVQAGDTLWAIARKHNVQTSDLLQWNKSDGKAPLRPGDTLVLLTD